VKINIDELKKAVNWLEANSRDVMVQIYTFESNKLTLKCLDRYENEVEIVIYEDGQMMPKIRKTEILK
jgi:hypothetical protein